MIIIIEIKFNDDLYPQKLRKIKNPPLKLYAIGNIDLLNKKSIAVIGTRHITEYGIKNCEYFTGELVKKGVPIVSGMAVGTDSVAHTTTLKFGGETIAVLGSGLKRIFPKENYYLFEKIIEMNGLVISEYAPNVSAKSQRFLDRNRIVSGLSEGILIIEAGYRSGTSVTAKHAYLQGKVVMALPGRLDNPYGVGVNKLIQEGAKLVTEPEDIFENIPQLVNKKWIKETYENKQISFWNVKEEYKEIIEILRDKTMTAEEIILQTNEKNAKNVMSLLLNMELENVVIQEIGVGYKLNG